MFTFFTLFDVELISLQRKLWSRLEKAQKLMQLKENVCSYGTKFGHELGIKKCVKSFV